VESRWTQTSPAQFPRSNELTVAAAAGSTDSGSTDSGSTDSGSTDSGSTDSGSTDSGSTDSGSTDSGQTADPSLGYLPVFPGAMGFGTQTKAGRGGQIIKVTNLNDSGSGSLRAALSASGPRIIVFEVSGTIKISSPLAVKNPYVTIAGQTAPSPGIQIIGQAFQIATHDVLVQHLRIRPGDMLHTNVDGLQILGSSTYNVVIDHVTASWGIDESASTYSTVKDVTISNSILSEGLASPYHPEGAHSMGLLIGDHAQNVAILNNLFAHNNERNPRIKGDVSTLVVNNLMYNGGGSVYMSIGADTGPNYVSAVGNVFMNGPDTPSTAKAIKVEGSASAGTKVYQADNQYSGTMFSGSGAVSTPPIWHDSVKVKDVAAVKSSVLVNAGARPGERDAAEERLIFEVQSGGGGIINSQNDVGGYPFLGESVRTFNAPADPNGDDDRDGYTNIEEYLQVLAAQVEK
jgi:pectate lyase